MAELKCKQCVHYYTRPVGDNGIGYNPAPCCWRYEDTGERPNILTQECFERRKNIKREVKQK